MGALSVRRDDAPGFAAIWRVDCGESVAFVVIHTAIRGRAFGGVRIQPYRDESDARADAMALARAMSRKVVMAGIEGGGAKSVLITPPAGARANAVRRLGEFIESLEGLYHCGPDLGFTADDEAVLRGATKYVACGGLASFTARSVLAAMDAACPAPSSVAIQGMGATGRPLAEALAARGTRVVACDVRPFDGFERIEPEAIYDVPCDVFAPCAGGGVLDANTIARLSCRVVCGSANNPLASDDLAGALQARGIVYVPDFIANAGATIQGASLAVGEGHLVEARLAAVGDRTRQILERAERERRSPHDVAVQMADERLAALVPRDAGRPGS